MKRLLLLLAKIVAVALALLLLVVLAVDVVFEAYGIPAWAASRVSAALADQGISLQADNIRAGLTRGLVLERAQVRLNCRGMPVILSCQELQVRPLLSELFSGRVRVRELAMRNAQASLSFGADSGETGERPSLRLERCNGVARRGLNGTVAVTLDGLAEKVVIHLDAELRNPESVRLERRPAAQPDGLEATLTRLSEAIAACRLSEREAFISGRLEVDLSHPDTLTFDGEAGVSNLLFGKLLVSHGRSDLHYRESKVRLDRLEVILGNSQALTGSLALDLESRRISGRVSGRILPEALWALAPASMPPWLERVTVLTPIEVTAELAPSPLAPSLWHVKAEAVAVNVALPGLVLARLAAAATWNGEELAVDHWRADLDSAGTEFAQGELRWHQADRTLEGRATLNCDLASRVRQTGPGALREALRGIEFTGPLLITADLERSPLDWRRLRLYGEVGVDGIRYHGRDLAPAKARVRLSAAVLSVEPLTVGLPDGPDDALALSATVDVAEAIASGTWKVAGSVSAKVAMDPVELGSAADAPATPPWGEALALRGTALVTPLTGALDVMAEGTAYPDRLYATLAPRLELPDNPAIQRIRCAQSSPVEGTLHVTRANRRQPPRLLASVHATSLGYGDLTFKTIESQIELSHKILTFSGLRAITQADDQLSLDLRIDLDPLAVTIRNARVIGQPSVVASFIEDPVAKAVYLAVWKDVRWSGAGSATIDLRQLVYHRIHGSQDWALTLDADLVTTAAVYRGLPIARLDANVLLDLPASITVRKIRVQTDSATAEGQCRIALAGSPKCTFELRHVDGGIDPLRLLGILNPEWGPGAGRPGFSPQSAVDCQGSFYLGSQPMLELDGSLRTPYFEYRGYRVTAPVVDWHLRQSAVHWNVASGELFGGRVALTGLYDVATRKGTLAIRAEALDFGQMGPACGLPVGNGAERGVLSADAQLEFLRGWGGRALRIYGNGHFSLTQADLWRVPLFEPLGRMLDVSLMNLLTGGGAPRLGRITRLDADLGFNGDRLVLPVLSTDGTVVSLEGRGEYCWETDELHGTVNGQLLDETVVLRLLLKPLSWVLFNAELTGTPKNCKWRLSTPVSKSPARSDSGRSPDAAPDPSVRPQLPDP